MEMEGEWTVTRGISKLYARDCPDCGDLVIVDMMERHMLWHYVSDLRWKEQISLCTGEMK
jgi:hypothetical protein